MNRFYKGYDDIAASDTFKQRMVRTLQSEARGETAAKSVRLPIGRRTLAILIAAAILVLAIGTAAAATIIGRKYYSPSTYMMNGKDEREQNEQTIPDIENAIASAKPETGDYSIVMLPEMENADELNAWRQIEEVLIDGNMLVYNIRMHTDHGMNFDWDSEHAIEGLSEEIYYTVEGDDTIHNMFGGGGTNPSSITADGATMQTEIDLDDLSEPFPTEGMVRITTVIHLRDVKVDDMNDVGLLALLTYSFTFDASAGADVAAPIVTERALSGSVVLNMFDNTNFREYNERVSLDGVVLEETLHFRSTGIYVTYKVKSAPEGWTEDYTNALLSPSPDSGGWPGFAVTCAPKGSTDDADSILPGKPGSTPAGEYTVILPFFPSDYEQIKAAGYELRLGYRSLATYNGEPAGDDWVQPGPEGGTGEYKVTTSYEPIASFDLKLP